MRPRTMLRHQELLYTYIRAYLFPYHGYRRLYFVFVNSIDKSGTSLPSGDDGTGANAEKGSLPQRTAEERLCKKVEWLLLSNVISFRWPDFARSDGSLRCAPQNWIDEASSASLRDELRAAITTCMRV